MPKKTTSGRGGAQRNRPRVQKNIELVRSASDKQELEVSPASAVVEPGTNGVGVTAVATATEAKQGEGKRSEIKQGETKVDAVTDVTAPKGSAAARLANRRQAAIRVQQRAAATLVTVEHYVVCAS